MSHVVTLNIPDEMVKRAKVLKINCSLIARNALAVEISRVEATMSAVPVETPPDGQ